MNRRMERLIPDDEYGDEVDELGQPEQEPEMITVPRDVFRDALAYSVVSKAGGRKVPQPVRPTMSGYDRDGNHSAARVLEYALPGGEIVARLVEACGAVETWLRPDLATDVLVARADAEAEKERIIREVAAYANATRRRGEQRAESYILSSALIHAAVRHNSRIGRLHDHNSRGDRVRANLAHALDRAVKAEGGAK